MAPSIAAVVVPTGGDGGADGVPVVCRCAEEGIQAPQDAADDKGRDSVPLRLILRRQAAGSGNEGKGFFWRQGHPLNQLLQTVSEGGLNLPRPFAELGEEGLGADCFAAKGDGDGTGNGDCAGSAAGVLMGNSTLVVCGLNQLLGLIVEEQANWAGSHSAAVAGNWGRGAGNSQGTPCASRRAACSVALPRPTMRFSAKMAAMRRA